MRTKRPHRDSVPAHSVDASHPVLSIMGRREITMTNATNTQPVVVGIDGSRTALGAALWAIDEAVERDVRCAWYMPPRQRGRTPHPTARTTLKSNMAKHHCVPRRPPSARPESRSRLKRRSAGPVDEALIMESRSASMLCVGSRKGWVARRVLGSTAAEVFRQGRTARWWWSDHPQKIVVEQSHLLGRRGS